MFYDCEDTEESDIYEDELYREESSSEQSIDSEVEFHLYSQVHYSQNLAEVSSLEVTEEADVAGFTDQSSVLTVTPPEDENIVELPDCDGQVSDDPEIIVLSDTPEEDSVYKSKAQKSTSSLAEGKICIHGSSIANHAKATERNALYPAGSDTKVSRQGRSGKLTSVGHETLTVQEVMVIDDSSNDEEESMISESDNVESWMLLGCSADDKDEDIMLNLEGCGAPIGEEKYWEAGGSPQCGCRDFYPPYLDLTSLWRGYTQPGSEWGTQTTASGQSPRQQPAADGITCTSCSSDGFLAWHLEQYALLLPSALQKAP